MDELTFSEIFTELSSYNAKKYVRVIFDFNNPWEEMFCVYDVNELLVWFGDQCNEFGEVMEPTFDREYNAELSSASFTISKHIFCEIYDQELTNQFKLLIDSIPFELDGKIYNENIIN
uniref:Uncharacterized protein n=1 Tax=viral metagenome TaxID=1070528 RepID=A0A6C0JSP1_9ZZZZ